MGSDQAKEGASKRLEASRVGVLPTPQAGGHQEVAEGWGWGWAWCGIPARPPLLEAPVPPENAITILLSAGKVQSMKGSQGPSVHH